MNYTPSICLYSSFFQGKRIPFYIRYYLEELCKHFDEILFVSTCKQLDEDSIGFLERNAIRSLSVENEGFDFGMWYKALKTIDANKYKRIGLVNDSCILFRKLDAEFKKFNECEDGYYGLVISDRFSRHLQSYFVLAQGNAVNCLVDYFMEKGIVRDYRNVIQTYEIGLSTHMIRNNYPVQGLYNTLHADYPENPSFSRIPELIEEGIPMIKKKIVFRNYRGLEYYWLLRMRFKTDFRIYWNLIKNKYNSAELIDIDQVMVDAPRKSLRDIYIYKVIQSIWNCLFSIPGIESLFKGSRKIYKKLFR